MSDTLFFVIINIKNTMDRHLSGYLVIRFTKLLIQKLGVYINMGYREDYFKENKSNNGWYTCTKCGKKLRKGDVDIDHIIPQKHGGSHKLYNLQCLCRYCNRSKQASLKDVPKDLSKNIAKQTKKELSKKIDAVLPTKPKSKTKKTASPTFKLFEKKKTSSKAKKNDKQSTSQKAGISLFGKKDKKYITLSKK